MSADGKHSAVAHWKHQRLTALANIPLMLWLVMAVIGQRAASYEAFAAWLSAPLNAFLMVLALFSAFYHAKLGTQVIVEDYVHDQALQKKSLTALKVFFIGAAAVCVLCVLKVAFAGSVS